MMKNKKNILPIIKFFIVGACVTILSGCMAPAKIPLTVKNRNTITATSAIEMLNQHEINVRLLSAAAYQRGVVGIIIGTIIDDHRKTVAEKRVAPFRNDLADLNFGKTFSVALQKNLTLINWLNLRSIKINYSLNRQNYMQEISSQKTKDILVIVPEYLFSSDFKFLTIEVVVTLYEKTTDEKQRLQLTTLYKNNFMYLYTPGNTWHKKQQGKWDKDIVQYNMVAWGNNHSRELRYAITHGIQQISQMVAIDIKNPIFMQSNARTTQYGIDGDYMDDDGYLVFGYKGVLLRKTPNDIILQLTDNSLLDLSQNVVNK